MDLKLLNSPPAAEARNSLKDTAVFGKPSPPEVDTAADWRRGFGKMRLPEFPSTPGRPVFSFSSSISKKGIPSKWDDAEKWLISSPSCTASPAHVDKEKPSVLPEMLLKDKFTDDPVKEESKGFFFRDIGTEMTPLGSSTTSRCNTPFKDDSPSRHNTPACVSGPLVSDHRIDIAHLQECHLAKLQLGTQYDAAASIWSTREEEEEDVSKSLRHSKVVPPWEEAEKAKCCLRFQREEAKIQAWVNLQQAKAEAQSKKLEVKILKMRSKLEEKQMKRMAAVNRKAEERRAALRQEHSDQIQKTKQPSLPTSCSCFPCNRQY